MGKAPEILKTVSQAGPMLTSPILAGQKPTEPGTLLREGGYDFDIAYTSVLKRAIKTLGLVQEEMEREWLPVIRAWQLNERHMVLAGIQINERPLKNLERRRLKVERSYDVPPPALELTDERHPKFDRRYASLTPEQLPATKSLNVRWSVFFPTGIPRSCLKFNPASVCWLWHMGIQFAPWSIASIIFPKLILPSLISLPACRYELNKD